MSVDVTAKSTTTATTSAKPCDCSAICNSTARKLIMRPSSVGGGRILRCTLSVRLSVCPSVPLLFILFYSRTLLRANIQNRKTSVFAYGPASRMYFSARTEGRISYGHLGGRTNSCLQFVYPMLVRLMSSSVTYKNFSLSVSLCFSIFYVL